MPVIQSNPPPEADEAVRAALRHFAGVPKQRLHALANTRPADLAPTTPHAIFTLSLSNLTTTASNLNASASTGWRYLLRQDDRVVANAETLAGTKSGARFSHFNSNPFVASTTAALKTAESLTETRNSTFEMRLLHVPTLYTMALQLHNTKNDNILIPLDPTPTDMEPNRPYPAAELLAILTEKERQIPKMGPNDTRKN